MSLSSISTAAITAQAPLTPRFVQLALAPSDSPVRSPRTAPTQTLSVCFPLRALLTFTTFLTKSPLKKKKPFSQVKDDPFNSSQSPQLSWYGPRTGPHTLATPPVPGCSGITEVSSHHVGLVVLARLSRSSCPTHISIYQPFRTSSPNPTW